MFQHPAVVLDALNECSEGVRGHLLRGLLSITGKAKCPLKVLISSRYNLDIETRLRGFPHVCIEARDKAEDIEELRSAAAHTSSPRTEAASRKCA